MTQKFSPENTVLALDVDGTLFDIGPAVVEGFQEGIQRFMHTSGKALPLPTHDEIKKVLGIPIHQIFATLFPNLTEDELQQLMAETSAAFVYVIREGKGRLYPHVAESISELHARGYRMVPASNGHESYIQAVLETYGLDGLFESRRHFLGGDIMDKSVLVSRYCEDYEGQTLVMIGDRHTDRQAAGDNGLFFIACRYGHGGADELEGADYYIDDFGELLQVCGE